MDRVLRAATRVFLERGFSATSMSDLVAATGMNRAGLYAAFGSKHQLYITALGRYREDTEPELRSITLRALERKDDERVDAPRVVGDLLDVVARHSKEGGFVVRAAVELADDPATMRRVQEAWTELERDLAAILARAVERGEMDPGTNPDRLARTVLVFVQGALVLGHADEDDHRLAEAAIGLVGLLAGYKPSATDDEIRSQAADDALLNES
ncbi:TetR/AcrR family transcriptional regulator [Glycomyces algeriensis]|uniref:TetR family transcriptional regulator n=1 Tax=Glycomyces algeriensis TaxID=256037 RepID=A0A9W6LFM5_9ACTN|nr:TetR/AcrR family transcriptional regulator [Glycomyces algeriensis]MDA1367052.1 TetR/AcrR family transcriptional regulator [Glycomyces algeriensis]MDR7348561.1 TetR/AcrR family transcriptional repressor of nem operon [Glycomyces algeriensis]GLI41265.1 TetR family transcriptional regulator [Glycomyces algeriensis]